MELHEFIEKAIIDIAIGVRSARIEAAEFISVAPPEMGGSAILEPSFIEFDIAVTVVSEKMSRGSKQGKFGSGIAVLGAKVGADGSLSKESSKSERSDTISRIAFRVPAHFNADARNDPDLDKERAYARNKKAEILDRRLT